MNLQEKLLQKNQIFIILAVLRQMCKEFAWPFATTLRLGNTVSIILIISQLWCFLTYAGQYVIVLRASGLKATSAEA